MPDTSHKNPDSFLLRLRKQDSPTGVTGTTIALLMEQTGLSKTEVTHLALRQLADRYLPKYALDDGALTEAELAAIRAASPATDIDDDRFTESLF